MADEGERLPSLQGSAYRFLVILSVVVVLVAGVLSALVMRRTAVDDASSALSREADVVASALDQSADERAAAESMDVGDMRLTLIASDGTVLYDNRGDAPDMTNHATRPEVASALSTGAGSAVRMSSTVGYVSIYQAVRLSSGDVVRLSCDQAGAMATFTENLPPLMAVLAALLVASVFASRLVVRRLVGPILAIDPAVPQATTPYVELAPLTRRIDEQQGELREQMERLRDSDQMRREFTSNVTHELKTPLASISGAAELIRDGIARPEDVPDFAGRIYDESARLTDLVNDILMLSKLDESERAGARDLLGSVESVDLGQTCRAVVGRLARQASERGVSISASGDPAIVTGNAHLLDELVYNLCDNAIRYNREGGVVSAVTSTVSGRPTLVVADTGIGIAPDQQEKVFERFYRVDAGRSRESGGTGLGLAIVKHAATFHGATLALRSEPGVGTTVTVTFPAADDPRE